MVVDTHVSCVRGMRGIDNWREKEEVLKSVLRSEDQTSGG